MPRTITWCRVPGLSSLACLAYLFTPRDFALRIPVCPVSQQRPLPAHNDVSTTMIYTHVLNRGGKGVRSPLDGLTMVLRPGRVY